MDWRWVQGARGLAASRPTSHAKGYLAHTCCVRWTKLGLGPRSVLLPPNFRTLNKAQFSTISKEMVFT